MTEDINYDLTLIEFVLLATLQPSYIEVSYQSGFVYVLVSKPEYKDWSLSERTASLFELVKFELPHILEKYSLIIEVLDENELTSLFSSYSLRK